MGIVGCGAMGQAHTEVWQSVREAQVIAVCDGNAARAEEVAKTLNARAFTDVEAMLDAGIVQAIDICTPSGLHADQALLAAERGVHILCEKPLDLNLEKVDRLLALCDRKRVTLACTFQQRTAPAVSRVRSAIQEGKLGRLLSCSASVKWYRSQEYYDSSAWRGTWAFDGGVLANQAIHTLDLLCWLVGEVEEVEYAFLETASHQMEAEDNALAILRFACGARGVFEATTCSYPDLCARIEIVGAEGSVAFDSTNVVRFGYGGEDRMHLLADTHSEIGGGRVNPMSISLQGHTELMQDFVRAVIEGSAPMISGREARVSLDALTKIYRKAFPNLVLGT
jgi:predicted dehydrogenase